jgi:beta-glucosidase/6-phospho-beta-glucosidase/beta-galactosidase
VSSTRHDEFSVEDYARIHQHGILTAREGLRWHLIETEPGRYDFSSAKTILEAGRTHGVQIVWDLLHFGWPAHLDIFDASWVEAFNKFAAAFGRWLRTETTENALVAPINEISFLSWAGGDTASLNPFALNRGAELKRQLVRAAVKASGSLREELPDVRLIAPEPVIHIVGNPGRPDDVLHAEQYRSAMFEAWDMLAGRNAPELGGHESFLDVIGLNYYDNNQWWNHGETIRRHEPEYRPFREIITEVYQRYGRPLFIAETGTEGDDRPHWLAYIAEEVRSAIQAGIPVEGICLYPILNHPGWDDGRHCHNGLWDYAQNDGTREIYQPLAEEIRRLRLQGRNYANPTNLFESAGCCVSLAPALELRVSTPTTLNEQICPDRPGLLH